MQKINKDNIRVLFTFVVIILLGFGTMNSTSKSYDFESENVFYNFEVTSSGNLSCFISGIRITSKSQVTRLKPYISYLNDTIKVSRISRNTWCNHTSEGSSLSGDSLILENSIEIEPQALDSLAFRTIILPSEMDTISYRLISGNNYVEHLILPDSAKIIEGIAISYLKSLKELRLPDGITYIGARAITSIPIHELTLPENLQILGINAFIGCPIKKLTLGSKIHYIPDYCFSGAELKSFPAANQDITLGEKALRFYTTDLVIPDNIVSIADNTFYPSIFGTYKSLTFGSGITTLKYRTFYSDSPETINLGGVKKVEEYAFFDVENLKELVITGNVEELAGFGFYRRWAEEGRPGNWTYYDPAMFNCKFEYSPKELIIFGLASNIKIGSIFLDRNVRLINGTSVQSSVGSNRPVYIENFFNLAKTVTFGSNVTHLPNCGFTEASTLEKFPEGLPVNLEAIGDSCFLNLNKVASLDLPMPLRKIGVSAFQNATGLYALTLPETLDSIGSLAFRNAGSLVVVSCDAAVPPVCNLSAFSDYTYLHARLEVPNPEAYRAAPGWRNFRNIVSTSGINGTTTDGDTPTVAVMNLSLIHI